jgi:hypothetical protein
MFLCLVLGSVMWGWTLMRALHGCGGHDRHTLGVDGSKVGVLEQTNQVRLRGLLKSSNSRRLEAEVRLEVLGNLADEALEGQLADQKLSRLLVAANLAQGNGAWAVAVGLLHSASGGGALAGSLGGERGAFPPVDLRAVCLVRAMVWVQNAAQQRPFKLRAPKQPPDCELPAPP